MKEASKSIRIVADAQTVYDAIKGALTFFGLPFEEMSKMTIEFEGRDITFRWKHLAIVMTSARPLVEKGSHPND